MQGQVQGKGRCMADTGKEGQLQGKGRCRAKGRASAGISMILCKLVPALLCGSFPSAWSGNCEMCRAAPQKLHLGLARGQPATQAHSLTIAYFSKVHLQKETWQSALILFSACDFAPAKIKLASRVDFRVM